MVASPQLRLEFRPARAAERGETARVLSEAFAGDLGLQRQVGLQEHQMPRFWEMQVDLFHAASPSEHWARILTCHDGGRASAALVLFEEGWVPDPELLGSHLSRYRKAFGLRAMGRYLRFSHEYSVQTRPDGRCLRLQSFGCDDASRGRGLGSTFLEWTHAYGRDYGHDHVQLEVQQDNRARELYLRHGYSLVRSIDVCGVPMDVMTRKL